MPLDGMDTVVAVSGVYVQTGFPASSGLNKHKATMPLNNRIMNELVFMQMSLCGISEIK